MAIQMRRGNKADFDPTKMLPGEWAVSIDSDTTKQWVWMCFAPGVVKRMAAFEDIEWVLSDEFAKSSVICDVELDSTATKAYAVGDYLMLHGHLYQVTAAIAIGDTITEGTNVSETTVMATIDGKVDKEAGKGLSTEDYTSAEKTKLGDLPTATDLQTALDGKVDKVEGKGLSTEDYTTTEKTKLAGLPTGTDLADDLSDLNQALNYAVSDDDAMKKASFDIDQSVNVFNPNAQYAIIPNSTIDSNGNITADNSRSILVARLYDLTSTYALLYSNSAGTAWLVQTVGCICFDGAFRNLGNATIGENGKRTPLPNSCYIGFDIATNRIDTRQPMIIRNWSGSNLPAFIQYTSPVLTVSEIENFPKEINDNSVYRAFRSTANLFDLTTITEGYYLASGGVLVEDSAYSTSDFIKVKSDTTYTGNFTNHLVWYDANKAYISRSNQVFTATSPSNAEYARIDFVVSVIPADEVMFVEGATLPTSYIPFLEPVHDFYAQSKYAKQWEGKTWAAYGDSITAISNGNGLNLGWAKYVNDVHSFGAFYGRGIGGQKYAWGNGGGSVSFINSSGILVSRNDSYNKDNYTGEVPAGTVACRGCFCSWDRITHMFPQTIKDTIDMIFVMGSTNDGYSENETLDWVANSNADPEWANSSEYAGYGGDYNIETMKGGVASTIMKMQAWMPNAIIVLATPLNGQTLQTGEKRPDYIPDEYEKGKVIKDIAYRFGTPCVDVFGTCGINMLNSPTYITDGTHPYNDAGKKMLARSVIGGIVSVYPNITD